MVWPNSEVEQLIQEIDGAAVEALRILDKAD